MKWLTTFVSILFFAQVVFGNAAIFSGADVKILKPNLNMNGQGKIMSGTVDPTSTATSASVGTIYLNTSNGNLYKKLDAGSSTNWEQIRQDNKNQLKNPSASTGVESWTNGGGTFVRTTTSGEFKSAPAGFSWTASGGGEVITSNSWSIPTNGTVNAVGYCYFAGTASNYDLELYTNGSTIEQAVDIPASTTFQKVEISFVAKSGSSYQIRARSYSGGTEINWDDCYLGENVGLTNVSQASLFGTAIQQGNTSTTCLFTENSSTATNNFVTLGTGSGCDAWTTTGSIGVTGTNSHSITIASMPPGEYLFEVSGIFQSDTASQSCYWRITDGTSGLSDVAGSFHANVYETSTSYLRGNYSVTTALTSKTFSIQAADDGAGICRLHNGITTGSRIAWKVWKYPTSNQIGTSAESTLTELVKYTPTFAGFGTVADVNIWSRRVGDSLEVSGYFQAGTVAASTATMTLGFNGVNGNVTIDTAKTAYGVVVGSAVTNQTASGTGPFSWSILTQSPGTLVGFGVQTSTVSSGSASNGNVFAANSNYVHLNFKVPITGWKSSVPVPVYIGSVTSNSSGAERVERVYVTNSGTPTISAQSGNWVSSLTDGGVGITTVNFAAGIFSGRPQCVVSQSGGGGTNVCYPGSATSSSSVFIVCKDNTDATADRDFDMICMGPR